MADNPTSKNGNNNDGLLLRIVTYIILIYSVYLLIKVLNRPPCKKIYKTNSGCGCTIEGFDGNTGVNYIDSKATWTFSRSNQSYFQSIALTSPDTESRTPSNLMNATVNRYLVKDSAGSDLYLLEIIANLYVLYGNVYDESNKTDVEQSYVAHMSNDKGENILLGELKKDNDGLYKLRVKTSKAEKLENFNKIQIIYIRDNEKQVILEGKF